MTDKNETNDTNDTNGSSQSCPHTALTQRWDNPNDMGKVQLATYVCEACGARFNYDEAQDLIQHPNVAAVEKGADAEDVGAPAEPVRPS